MIFLLELLGLEIHMKSMQCRLKQIEGPSPTQILSPKSVSNP